eukprot:1156008-Pelagomonas_calceolata.AAC.2
MPGKKKRGRPPLLRPQGGDDAAAGLTGKAVLVPSCALAALASVHGHDRYLHGIIKGKDSGHQGCVLIKCREDPRTFYFDVGQVQGWMQKKEEGHVVISNANAQSRGQKEKHGKEEEQQSKRACVGHANRGSGHSIPNIDLTAEISRPKQYAPAIPPKKGYTMKAEVADLTGKEVDIPGTVFQNHTPGLTFRNDLQHVELQEEKEEKNKTKEKSRPAKRPCAYKKGSLISSPARFSPKGPQT